MHLIVWRFEVPPGRENEFEREYGPDGSWAALFRQGRGFLETELLRSTSNVGVYYTFDRWSGRAAFEGFRSSRRDEYAALDRRTEQLTVREERIGAMDDGIEIRPATVADVAGLTELMCRTFVDTYAAQNTAEDVQTYLQKSYGVEQQTREVTDERWTTLIAEREGAPIAFGQLRRHASPAVEDPSALEVFRFYVDRRWHGVGVAQELMRGVSEAAAARGARSVWLGVWEKNPRAIAFYAKCGFRDVGTQQFTIGNDVQTDRVMVCALPIPV